MKKSYITPLLSAMTLGSADVITASVLDLDDFTNGDCVDFVIS